MIGWSVLVDYVRPSRGRGRHRCAGDAFLTDSGGISRAARPSRKSLSPAWTAAWPGRGWFVGRGRDPSDNEVSAYKPANMPARNRFGTVQRTGVVRLLPGVCHRSSERRAARRRCRERKYWVRLAAKADGGLRPDMEDHLIVRPCLSFRASHLVSCHLLAVSAAVVDYPGCPLPPAWPFPANGEPLMPP